MFVAAILAAVALAQQTSVAPSASYSALDNPHAAIQRLANQPSWDPQALHEQVTTGETDESWSPAAEARLSALYGAISGVAPSDLSVRCSADLCEVAGTTATELSRNRAFDAIQGVQAITRADGLVQTGYAVGAGPAETLAFLTYWRRDD